MPMSFLPQVEACCGCVTDLKTATAIIAVLGIVTSPAVSWAVIRHTYIIRVSCHLSSSLARPDVVDVSFNNVLSFGFGANAGFGPSCLSRNRTNIPPSSGEIIVLTAEETDSAIVSAVRYFGWALLIIDLIFLICSIFLLLKLFNGSDRDAVKCFMISGAVAAVMAFIYSMLYVAACVSLGGAFPIIEFLFGFIDLFIWAYFLVVVYSYSQRGSQ